MAHIGKARALQLSGDLTAMRESLTSAQALSEGGSARDFSHIEVFRRLFAGQPATALAAVRTHSETWPRDALVLSLAANQGGLIGMSGLSGREQDLVDFLSQLPATTARTGGSRLTTAWRCRKSANMTRHAPNRAIPGPGPVQRLWRSCFRPSLLRDWRARQRHRVPAGLVAALHSRWRVIRSSVLASGSYSNCTQGISRPDFISTPMPFPRTIIVARCTRSSRIRSRSCGVRKSRAIRATTPAGPKNPGVRARQISSPRNVSRRLARRARTAAIGDDAAFKAWIQAIEDVAQAGRYPSDLIVPAAARAFAAFQRGDYSGAIDLIVPLLPERERMGGSRAQVDLVEATLLRAYFRSGRLEEAQRLLANRRSGPAALPIAGSDMLH